MGVESKWVMFGSQEDGAKASLGRASWHRKWRHTRKGPGKVLQAEGKEEANNSELQHWVE